MSEVFEKKLEMLVILFGVAATPRVNNEFQKIFEPVGAGDKIPEECIGCQLHACERCPYANNYMKTTHGYLLLDLYNPILNLIMNGKDILIKKNEVCSELSKKIVDYTTKDYIQQEQAKIEVDALLKVLMRI